MSRRAPAVACLVAALLVGPAARADESDRPEILSLVAPDRVAVGRLADMRVVYRARRANVVAVVQIVDDLDGPRRSTRQRELGMVTAAFGREAGDLLVPIDFVTPGRKRVVVTLVTDEREESEPASIELQVVP
jgi:hypothetical protein